MTNDNETTVLADAIEALHDAMNDTAKSLRYVSDDCELACRALTLIKAITDAIKTSGYDRMDIWAHVVRSHANDIDVELDETKPW